MAIVAFEHDEESMFARPDDADRLPGSGPEARLRARSRVLRHGRRDHPSDAVARPVHGGSPFARQARRVHRLQGRESGPAIGVVACDRWARRVHEHPARELPGRGGKASGRCAAISPLRRFPHPAAARLDRAGISRLLRDDDTFRASHKASPRMNKGGRSPPCECAERTLSLGPRLGNLAAGIPSCSRNCSRCRRSPRRLRRPPPRR